MCHLERDGIWISSGLLSKFIPYAEITDIRAMNIFQGIFSRMAPFKPPMTRFYCNGFPLRFVVISMERIRHMANADHPDRFVAQVREQLRAFQQRVPLPDSGDAIRKME